MNDAESWRSALERLDSIEQRDPGLRNLTLGDVAQILNRPPDDISAALDRGELSAQSGQGARRLVAVSELRLRLTWAIEGWLVRPLGVTR